MSINKDRDNAVKPSGVLTPSLAFIVGGIPDRIDIPAGLIEQMEARLDLAIAAARKAGGVGLAIEIFNPQGGLVVRRAVP